jgi:hypothetical protein
VELMRASGFNPDDEPYDCWGDEPAMNDEEQEFNLLTTDLTKWKPIKRGKAKVSASDADDPSTEFIVTAETMGVTPGQPDLWCYRVTQLIETASLAEAGHELAQLANYALKTQHSDHFNRQVRDCVLMFWERCDRTMKRDGGIVT